MRSGTPLSDEDRWPWLQRLSDAMAEELSVHSMVVTACSALQPRYRQFLSGQLERTGTRPVFVLLEPSAAVLKERVARRQKAANHFMPPSLLQSQLDLLEYDEGEWYFHAQGTPFPPLEQIVDALVEQLRRDGAQFS